MRNLELDNVTFCWLVANFTQKKGDGGYIYSPTFYSHTNGYKMVLALYANGSGSGEGSHVSLFLKLMKGPNDDQLQWPYRWKYQLTIVSPTGGHEKSRTFDPAAPGCSSGPWEKPASTYNTGCGKAQFLAHTELQQYLKQDQMLITVKLLE